MKQTRKASFIEASLNMALGFAVSMAAQIVIFPAFGIHIGAGAHIGIGLAFTIVSIARSYALRRLFETLRVRGIMP